MIEKLKEIFESGKVVKLSDYASQAINRNGKTGITREAAMQRKDAGKLKAVKCWGNWYVEL